MFGKHVLPNRLSHCFYSTPIITKTVAMTNHFLTEPNGRACKAQAGVEIYYLSDDSQDSGTVTSLSI